MREQKEKEGLFERIKGFSKYQGNIAFPAQSGFKISQAQHFSWWNGVRSSCSAHSGPTSRLEQLIHHPNLQTWRRGGLPGRGVPEKDDVVSPSCSGLGQRPQCGHQWCGSFPHRLVQDMWNLYWVSSLEAKGQRATQMALLLGHGHS